MSYTSHTNRASPLNVILSNNNRFGWQQATAFESKKLVFGCEGVTAARDSFDEEQRTEKLTEACQNLPQSALQYIQRHILPKLAANRRNGRPNWTNNNAESMNHVIKTTTQWRKQKMPNLIDKLRTEVVNYQYSNVRSAIIGTGEFSLAPDSQRYSVEPNVWSGMSVDRRRRALDDLLADRKSSSHVGKANRQIASSDGRLHVRTPPGGRKPHQRRRGLSERTRSK